MNNYIEKEVFYDPCESNKNLRITAFIDRPDWQFEVIRRDPAGPSTSALVLSIKEPPQTTVRKEKKSFAQIIAEKMSTKSKKSGSRLQKAVAEVVKSRTDNVISSGVDKPTYPAPFSLQITAQRKLRTGYGCPTIRDARFYSLPASSTGDFPEEMGTWSVSGQIKEGGKYRIRVDGIVDLMKEEDLPPHDFFLILHVRSKRNLKLENQNTAVDVLPIGDDKFEFVSKEILGLFSKQFNAMFYKGFADWGMMKMKPMNNESRRAYEESLMLLFEFMHNRDLSRVDIKNIGQLLKTAKRYECQGTIKRIEDHLIRLCNGVEHRQKLHAALLAADENGLKEATRYLIAKYHKFEDLARLYSTMKDTKMSPSLVNLLFEALMNAHKEVTYNSACHLYFRCFEGNAVVQLNRARLPKTVTLLIKHFSAPSRTGPLFYWDEKKNLTSAECAPDSFWTGEEAKKDTVPDGCWAFVLRRAKDGRSRLTLVQDRPVLQTVYLGYVVKGGNVINGDNCTNTGVHYFAV